MTQVCDYAQALEYLKQKQSLGVKPGLERIQETLDVLLNPQNSYSIIHIAGTNGKGTVAATLAKALQDSGYKVGLFTSPWITDYREQIQVNGKFISEDELWRAVRALQMMDTSCTEFECLTVIAYLHFKLQKVDYAVVECGMGGKGDATNVEKKNLSVITSISLDHTDYFGETVEQIAEEKSGILRKDCTCFLYNDELKEIFEPKCQKLITGNLRDNLMLVNAVLNELGVAPVAELVHLPGRLEKRGNVLIDGGHNVSAALRLAPLIQNETAVIGMMRDKDVDGYLRIVAPKCKRIITVNVNHPRALPAAELASRAKVYCGDVTTAVCTKEALRCHPTLICGSFYMIREINNLI